MVGYHIYILRTTSENHHWFRCDKSKQYPTKSTLKEIRLTYSKVSSIKNDFFFERSDFGSKRSLSFPERKVLRGKQVDFSEKNFLSKNVRTNAVSALIPNTLFILLPKI